MATLYALKPGLGRMLRPVLARMARVGVIPNHITIATAAFSLAVGGCILVWPAAQWPLLALPAVLLLRMVLNTADGELARGHGMTSRAGILLGELCDVISESALYLPLAFVPGVNGVLAVLMVIAALLAEMSGAVAVQAGSPRRFDGPLAKPDRAVLVGGCCVALGLGYVPAAWLNAALAVAILLGIVTAFNRARNALAAG